MSDTMLCSWERSPDPAPVTFVQLPADTTEPLPDLDSDLPPIELRFAPDVRLAFHGTGATIQCLQLLQGLGYGLETARAHQAVQA